MRIFYSSSLRGFNTGAADEKEISLERHAELLDAQTEGAEILPDANGYPIAQMPMVTIKSVAIEKLVEIKRWASAAEEALTDEYTAGEMASWPTQQEEARALIRYSNASAPLLRGIAKARGLEVIELARKVRAKNNFFAEAAAQIYGRRQALVDRVEAAKNIAEIYRIIVVDNGEP